MSKFLSLLVSLLSLGGAQAVCPTGQYEKPNCAVHDNWRKNYLGAHVEIKLGSVDYGGITNDWMTCLAACHNSAECLQVVWVKSTRRCYGMSDTSDEDQDGLGGRNVNFISAICTKARAFDWDRSTDGLPWQQGVLGHANTPYDWGNGATSLASISEDSSAVGVRFKLSSPGQIFVGLTAETDQAAILSQGAGIEYFMYASTYHQQKVFVGDHTNPQTSFSWANGDSFEIRLDATRAVVQFFQNDELKSTMTRTSFPLKFAVSMGVGSVYDLSWVQASTTTNPNCVSLTACTDCQYEAQASSQFSDRKCKAFPECADGQCFDAQATEMTGRVCKKCTPELRKRTNDCRHARDRHDRDYPNTCWFIEENSDKGTGGIVDNEVLNDWSHAATVVGSSSAAKWDEARCKRYRGFSQRRLAKLLCGSVGREGDPQECSQKECLQKCKDLKTDGCCQYIEPKARRLSLAHARLSTLV